MCVFGGRGIVSQLSSERGTILAGVCSVIWSGIVSCNTWRSMSAIVSPCMKYRLLPS
jgi:hypothetical protein